LNPWQSAITSYYKAIGEIPDDLEPSMAMRIGTKLEDDILEIFAEEHPEFEVFETGTWASRKEPRFHANPDALFKTKDDVFGVVEIKFSRDYWTEVPKHYRAQVLWYCHVLGLKHGILVALAGSTYQEFVIEYDEFEVQSMVAGVRRFLDAVDNRVQPAWDGSNSTYETMRIINPNIDADAEPVELGDLGADLVEKQKDVKYHEDLYRELQSRVLAKMGTAKYGAVDGLVIVQRQQRGAYAPHLTFKRSK
jgi:predicted phage-related endonuclease